MPTLRVSILTTGYRNMRLLGMILIAGARLSALACLGLILAAGYIQDKLDGRNRH